MTFSTDITQTPVSVKQNTGRLGCNDPILQELWAIKAKMNAESGYSIQQLAKQARQFNLKETLTHLHQEFHHSMNGFRRQEGNSGDSIPNS